MLLPTLLLLLLVLSQLEDIGLGDLGHILHGLSQLGIEGLTASLFALDMKTPLHGLPDRLDCGGLQDLALSKGTDHALTMRA